MLLSALPAAEVTSPETLTSIASGVALQYFAVERL
jgi:hypothetical protein